MSDKEKTTPKIFKFGDNQYTVTDYNTAYDQNVQDFIEFAKQRGQFDDTSIKLLQEALLTKRGQINNGEELNHLGGHNDDTVHNVSIPTYERRGLRKKEKYVDQDITEWVNYFNRSIIGKMNKYSSESEKNPKDWDINKYGLLTAFNTRSAESYFNDYDKASGDGTTPRGFTQRNSELLSGLQRYNNILKDYNFDYTKNDDWRDNDYQTILKDLETELSNTNPNQQKIAQLLRNAGFTNDYITAFTSDQHKWNESLTQTASAYKAEQDAKAEQKAKEQQEQKAKQDATAKANFTNKILTNYQKFLQDNNYIQSNNEPIIQIYPYTFTPMTKTEFDKWWNNFDDKTSIGDLMNNYSKFIANNTHPFGSGTYANHWYSYITHTGRDSGFTPVTTEDGETYFIKNDDPYANIIVKNDGVYRYYPAMGSDDERKKLFKKYLNNLINDANTSDTDKENIKILSSGDVW